MPAVAHGAASGGPNAEILLLGIGMIVVSGVFFVQKSASPRLSLVLLVLGAAAVTGAFTVARPSADDHGDVAVSIASPERGAAVPAGEPVPFQFELTGAVLASESSGEEGGHLHVLVDGETVGMPSALDVELELEEGEHEIEVEYVGPDHQPLDPPVTDSITVTAE